MTKLPLAITVLAVLLSSSVWAQAPQIDDKKVSIEADSRPLTEVLADLAKQTGVGLIAHGTDAACATLSLTDLPFRDCMNALADMFSLLASREGNSLVVRTVPRALSEANSQLDEGRIDAVNLLIPISTGKVSIYGSEKLRQSLAAQLTELINRRTTEALTSESLKPLLAWGLARIESQPVQTRSALAAAAVRGFLRQGLVEAALGVWDALLQEDASPQTTWAWAELFSTLHQEGSELAPDFWRKTFSVARTIAVLEEGWRLKSYLPALQFARLNADYAEALGRQPEAEQLRTAVAAQLGKPRVIDVTCAVDREAAGDPKCESKVRSRVEQLSKVFEHSFGIQFRVTNMIPWDPPSDSDFDRQYRALKAALGPLRPELTVGFILEVFEMHPAEFRPGHLHLWTGYGCPHVGAYLLTRDFAFEYVGDIAAQEWTLSSGHVAETLVHEMGHMFGALHVDLPESVMRPRSADNPVFEFDEANRKIVLAQKWKDLRVGVESLDEPELLAILDGYAELAKLSERSNGALEETARVRLALAKLYEQRQDFETAKAQLKQVLAIGVPSEIVAEAQEMLAG